VDPMLLYVVAGGARAIAADGRRDEAVALLQAQLARCAAELAPRHYAVGELQLALAELLATSAPADAQRLAADALASFDELPAGHPWRTRAAALSAAGS